MIPCGSIYIKQEKYRRFLGGMMSEMRRNEKGANGNQTQSIVNASVAHVCMFRNPKILMTVLSVVCLWWRAHLSAQA